MTTYDLYSSNQDAIEGVLRYVCRKEHLAPDRAEEFSQWTRLKLIDDDCAILRSFKGTCPFKNFLITVVLNKYRDWLDENHGKFRVTAEAKRLGPVATTLERLVLRDKLTYDEAVQVLLSKGMAKSISECDDVWGRLKRAPRRIFVDDEVLEHRSIGPSQDPVERAERRELTRKMHDAMTAAIAALPDGDRLILRLNVWDHVSVANIARLQQTEQKPLYRRIEQIKKTLEAGMVARGISVDDVRGLFRSLGFDAEVLDEVGK